MRRSHWVVRVFMFGGLCLGASPLAAQEPDPPASPEPAADAPAADSATPTAAAAPPTKPSTTSAPATDPAVETAGRDEPGDRPGEPRFDDANSDRVILFSTAETHPKGTFFFSDYEIFLLQFGYAITDEIQIALSGVPPIIEDQPYFFDLSLKGTVLRSDWVRLGIIGAGTAILLPDANPDSLFGVRANGVAQLCFERLCRSSFSFNAGTFLNSESNAIVPITLAGGVVLRASNLVKFLLEPAYSLAIGDGVEDQPEGFLLNYGIRLSGTHFGFDLAFLRPIGTGEDGGFILGVPWLALTYRTSGDER